MSALASICFSTGSASRSRPHKLPPQFHAATISVWLLLLSLADRRRFSSCFTCLGFQTRHNLFSGDRMFSYPDTAGIVDCVRQRAWRGADGRLGKAFRSEEPAGLQAIHEYLCLFRDVHDSGKPVGQVADAEVTRARKFAIPWNALRRDLSALDQRSIHIGFGQ